jgi:hypothetical protein
MKNFMLLTLAIILMFACQPDETVIPEGEVTIHLLTSFETTGNSCRIDGASAQWDSNALLNYEDLENYDVENYAFKLSEEAIDIIDNMDHNVQGVGFVLLADEAPIYTGYFWPAYSSMSCDWLTADPLMVEMTGELRMRLGYPGQATDGSIPDLRNEKIILDIFRRDGKLIE